jgi:hypothetical protein
MTIAMQHRRIRSGWGAIVRTAGASLLVLAFLVVACKEVRPTPSFDYFEAAFKLVEEMQPGDQKTRTFNRVLKYYAAAGYVHEAIERARTLSHGSSEALKKVVWVIRDSGDLDLAIEIGRSIPEPLESADVMESLARSLGEAERPVEALALLEAAYQITLTADEGRSRSGMMAKIAGRIGHLGERIRALQILSAVLPSLCVPSENSYNDDWLREELAREYAYAGLSVAAILLAATTSDPDSRTSTFRSVACKLEAQGQHTLTDAIIRNISPPTERARALIFVADYANMRKDRTRLAILLRSATTLASDISPEETQRGVNVRSMILKEIAKSYSLFDFPNEAHSVAKMVDSPEYKASALSWAADAYRNGDLMAEALAIGADTVQYAKDSNNLLFAAGQMAWLASTHDTLGDRAKALGLMDDAVALCRRGADDSHSYVSTRNALAKVFANQGKFSEAVELLSSKDSQRLACTFKSTRIAGQVLEASAKERGIRFSLSLVEPFRTRCQRAVALARIGQFAADAGHVPDEEERIMIGALTLPSSD